MKSTLSFEKLLKYLETLLFLHFPDSASSETLNKEFSKAAFKRLESCLIKINSKYYNINNSLVFNHLNADHMTILLYFFANTFSKDVNNNILATKFSYLNKILHGVDMFYHVKLPEIFKVGHPLGSVIGNAEFKNYLVFGQNVTIGAKNSFYPKMGEGVILNSGSSVVGNCLVGNNVTFGANAFIIDSTIPDNSIVVGQFPNHRILINKYDNKSKYFF